MMVLRSRVLYYGIIFTMQAIIGRVWFPENGLVMHVVVAAFSTGGIFVLLERFFRVQWGSGCGKLSTGFWGGFYV